MADAGKTHYGSWCWVLLLTPDVRSRHEKFSSREREREREFSPLSPSSLPSFFSCALLSERLEQANLFKKFKASYFFLNSYIWCFLVEKSNLRVQRNNTLNLECKEVRDQFLENLGFPIRQYQNYRKCMENWGFLKTDHGLLCTPDLAYCFFELQASVTASRFESLN